MPPRLRLKPLKPPKPGRARRAPTAKPARTLSTPSAARPSDGPASPDESLADIAYSHRGLTYPLGRAGPEYGAVIALADGIGWTRSPVPGSLNHINLWMLDDGDSEAGE